MNFHFSRKVFGQVYPAWTTFHSKATYVQSKFYLAKVFGVIVELNQDKVFSSNFGRNRFIKSTPGHLPGMRSGLRACVPPGDLRPHAEQGPAGNVPLQQGQQPDAAEGGSQDHSGKQTSGHSVKLQNCCHFNSCDNFVNKHQLMLRFTTDGVCTAVADNFFS
jgi:hypothetical protein